MDELTSTVLDAADALSSVAFARAANYGFQGKDKVLAAHLVAVLRATASDTSALAALAALLTDPAYADVARPLLADAFDSVAEIGRGVNIDAHRAKAANTVIASAHVDDPGKVAFRWHGFREDYADAVKTLGGRPTRDAGGYAWLLPLDAAHDAAQALQARGAEIVGSFHTAPFAGEEVAPTKIEATLIGEKTVRLHYGFNRRFNEVLRKLPAHAYHYDFKTRTWFIPVAFVPHITDALRAVGADVSDLDPLVTAAPVVSRLAPDEQYVVKPEVMAKARVYQETGIRWLLRPLSVLREQAKTAIAPYRDEYKGAFGSADKVRGLILGDDMGLGKSFESLVAADAIAQPGETVVIVTKASVKHKWATKEIALATGDEKPSVIVLGGKVSLDPDAPAPRYVILNYDILDDHYDALRLLKIAVLILDEAHEIKGKDNIRTKLILGGMVTRERAPTVRDARTKARQRVDGLANLTTRRVFCLTGTAVPNRLTDLWVLLRAIGHPFGDDYNAFGKRFCKSAVTKHAMVFVGVRGHNEAEEQLTLEELRNVTAPVYLARQKEDVMSEDDVPAFRRTFDTVQVDLEGYRRAMLAFRVRRAERREERYAAWRKDFPLAPQDAFPWQEDMTIVDMTEARQSVAIATVPNTIAYAEKVLADDPAAKIVLWSCFTEPLEAMKKHFGKTAAMIHGGTTPKARVKAIDAFQNDPSIRVFLGNVAACGEGIDLTAGNEARFNDLPFTPKSCRQPEKRIDRIGQTRPTHASYAIAAGTIAEDLAVLLQEKFKVASGFEVGNSKALFRDLLQRLDAAQKVDVSKVNVSAAEVEEVRRQPVLSSVA